MKFKERWPLLRRAWLETAAAAAAALLGPFKPLPQPMLSAQERKSGLVAKHEVGSTCVELCKFWSVCNRTLGPVCLCVM